MPEEKMHFKDYRSGMLTNGIERAAHRALLYSTGLDREDLGKPMIAVVNSFTEMVPGHFHLRELADFVKQGIIEAGGIPREFSTIAICDGICQGHKGMSYPLPSRELIADSAEYMIEAHQFDGMVMLPGCDKIVPGMVMAAMRLNIPAIVVPGGPMLPGKYKDMEAITLTDMRELIGRTQTGRLTEDELMKIEEAALPGVGTCAMLGTANTMSCLAEALGMSLPKLVAGSFVGECIFAWPGLGRLCVTAIFNRDLPVIQAYVLLMAVLFVAGNLCMDICAGLLDPRLRERGLR